MNLLNENKPIIGLFGEEFVLSQGGVNVRVKSKFVDFLCLLICRSPDTLVTRHDLVALESWSANKPLSAGKQIARFLESLNQKGISLLSTSRKTDGWGLSDEFRASILETDIQRAKELLNAKQLKSGKRTTEEQNELLFWYAVNFKALVALTSGDARNGYTKLRDDLLHVHDDEQLAISNVLLTRLEQRIAESTIPIFPSSKLPIDPFVRAIEFRRVAAYALHANSNEWNKLENIFRQYLATLAGSGDFLSIAILKNALGILLRRLGKVDEALGQISDAAKFGIFSGDIILIQNIAFNLANIASEIHRLKPKAVNFEVIASLLEFDAEIRTKYGFGRDSAQSELLLAYLYYERRDLTKAKKYLKMAKVIIEQSGLRADEALMARVEGLIIAAEATDKEHFDQAIDLLEKSKAIYLRTGYNAAADWIDGEIAAILHPS
ncbi:hypothetical protein [Parasphingorhabdus sp.]|uniref:hypothetical protein n=1 Tax=Parasphingorhabdus sp. TaxID=2709688 RepID=UPI003001A1DB